MASVCGAVPPACAEQPDTRGEPDRHAADARAVPVFTPEDGAPETGPPDSGLEAEASVDASAAEAAVAEDAAADSPSETPVDESCRCEEGRAFRVVMSGPGGEGPAVELRHAFLQRLHCVETAPLLLRLPCFGLVRVSACAGPGNGPPCLYVAVRDDAAWVGHLVDALGTTRALLAASIDRLSVEAGVARGKLRAAFQEGAAVEAEFEVCAPPPEC